MSQEPEILCEQRAGLGLLTLNRPKTMNALTHTMVRRLTEVLHRWAQDSSIRTVALTGAGERGLCAGGDIVAIYHDARAAQGGTADVATGPTSAAGQFWRDEYLLNDLISRYPKPFVAFMDGIVLGGGVGLSGHASHRIVTERSRVGMPEVGIGFIPDVGGTYLLSRAPGELGTHLALTAAQMTAGDAIAAGFADYYVPAAQIPDFLDRLRDQTAQAVCAEFAHRGPGSVLATQRDWIDTCYRGESVTDIVDRLTAAGDAAARAADSLLTKSPVAVHVTLRALRSARHLPGLAAVLNQEYRTSVAALRSHDLVEGIRAQVVDKDRNPHWSPDTFAGVTHNQVAAYFADLGDHELGL